jgi:hypothetical protein
MAHWSDSSNVEGHQPKLEVPGLGTWTIRSDTGEITFYGQRNFAEGIRANLWKFLDGGSKPKFVDSALRFVLLDAQDEMIRGDAFSGELRTLITLERIADPGLRRSEFVSAATPVFIFERGVVAFNRDGWLQWFRNDLRLDHHFKVIEGDQIVYFSEHRGEWRYNLFDGRITSDSRD